MKYDVAIIGAPSSAGAYAPGQEKAPSAFRRHGIVDEFTLAGLRVMDAGDTPVFRWRPDPANPKSMNVREAAHTARALAELAERALHQAELLLVLGGDCTIELGTVAGVAKHGGSIGLLYVDLDVDLNIPETSDGALDWTGVAHILDLPGSADLLAGLSAQRPLLFPQSVMFYAAEIITPPEADAIARLKLPVISARDVRASTQDSARRAFDWARSFDHLLVHVDVDVLEYTRFPIAENVRREPQGLDLEMLAQSLDQFARAPNFRALTITEVNPEHAPDEAPAFKTLVEMLRDTMRTARSSAHAPASAAVHKSDSP